MSDVNYEMPWRTNYEMIATATWAGSAVAALGVNYLSAMPPQPFWWITGVCGVMVMRNLPKAIKLSQLQRHLGGRDLDFMTLPELQKLTKKHPTEMWLGYGFPWEQRHAQRSFEILKRDWSIVESMQRKRAAGSEPPIGQSWIHGIEPKEQKLYQPLKHAEGHTLIVGTTGSGKAQPLDANVLTPSGWRKMGDIQQGDTISTPDGGTAMVTGVFPQGVKTVYRVGLADGRHTEACADHLWKVHVEGNDEAEVIDTATLFEHLANGRGCRIPLTQAQESPASFTSVEPYAAGVLAMLPLQLSDCERVLDFGCTDIAVVDTLSRHTPASMKVDVSLGTGYAARLAMATPNPELVALTQPEKPASSRRLPELLLNGSISQRTGLLTGVLDACGEYDSEHHCVNVLCAGQGVGRDIQQLVWSLGGTASLKAYIEPNTTSLQWLLSVRHPKLHHYVSAPRLAHRLNELADDAPVFSQWVDVCRVAGERKTQAQCISVDHPDHLYITDNYIITHNTRMFDMLISQAILRGEAVIIVDPKGDKELQENARRACEAYGEPERFVSFHPAFPETSVRIDPLRNFTRVTEIASRISALIPSESGADPFTAFGWQALNNIAQGLIIAEDRPTLAGLRRILEGGASGLVIKAISAYCDEHIDGWAAKAEVYLQKAKKDTRDARAMALTLFYYAEVQPEKPSSELEGLLSMFEHDGTHFAKMVANLLPIMNMLTSGELGAMLSPNYDDVTDRRPILDTAKIVDHPHVAYIGLDSLTDNVVASAIGSMILSDLTAVAGDRYNFGEDNKMVNIFVDEAAEVISDSMITLLNKGRGSKFRLFVATQTFADFAARLGSQEKALQVLGNINNTLALRVKDTETQEYITKGLPTTRVQYVMRSQSMNTHSDEPVLHGGGQGERLMEEEAELFPPQLLGMLPNLEFIGNISGGRLIKGRLPILVDNK